MRFLDVADELLVLLVLKKLGDVDITRVSETCRKMNRIAKDITLFGHRTPWIYPVKNPVIQSPVTQWPFCSIHLVVTKDLSYHPFGIMPLVQEVHIHSLGCLSGTFPPMKWDWVLECLQRCPSVERVVLYQGLNTNPIGTCRMMYQIGPNGWKKMAAMFPKLISLQFRGLYADAYEILKNMPKLQDIGGPLWFVGDETTAPELRFMTSTNDALWLASRNQLLKITAPKLEGLSVRLRSTALRGGAQFEDLSGYAQTAAQRYPTLQDIVLKSNRIVSCETYCGERHISTSSQQVQVMYHAETKDGKILQENEDLFDSFGNPFVVKPREYLDHYP
jgi:hypothetical protein